MSLVKQTIQILERLESDLRTIQDNDPTNEDAKDAHWIASIAFNEIGFLIPDDYIHLPTDTKETNDD
jgi:hypothetical protein